MAKVQITFKERTVIVETGEENQKFTIDNDKLMLGDKIIGVGAFYATSDTDEFVAKLM